MLWLGLSAAAAAISADESAPAAEIESEIMLIIDSRHHPYLSQGGFANRADDLKALYQTSAFRPVWLDQGDSDKNIGDVFSLLASAADHGLNAGHYDIPVLRQKFQRLLAPENAAGNQERALFDTALSISLLRFLHDLHYGRINPQSLKYNLKLREKKLVDFPTLIAEHAAKATVPLLAVEVEPKLQQYEKLKRALVRYRHLAADPVIVNFSAGKTVRPNEKFPRLPELHKYLLFLGDLQLRQSEGEVGPLNTVYKGEVVGAVKKFQQRHGLQPDGVLGKSTIEALNIPVAQRVIQLELALERLRWLPELDSGPLIIVNIPSFQLWAFRDFADPAKDIVNMKVVVGKALKNQTPVLMARMSFVDFMPYWNVPYNIVKKEILPRWEQDPAYLAKQDMELVTGFGNEVKAVSWSDNAPAYVRQGLLKIRQRPGRKNPLGSVKFIFPNKDDVYLHGTAANSLFGRSRRDFSHGCVRVERPEDLANFVLGNKPKWSPEIVHKAMNSPKTQRVLLDTPIPVLFFYTTSFVEQDGTVMFYADIYGQDAILVGALKNTGDLSDNVLFVSREETAQVEQAPAAP